MKLHPSRQKPKKNASTNTHYQELLGKDPEEDGEITIDISPFLQGLEYLSSHLHPKNTDVKKKHGKSCGPDRAPPEVFTVWPRQQHAWLHKLPKSRDLSTTNNYSGIAPTSNAGKLANRIILNKILRIEVDPLLHPNQNGLRSGMLTTVHILALRRLGSEATIWRLY